VTRRVLAAAPAALVAALALATAPAQVRTAREWLAESPKGLARGEDAARRELRGDAYANVLDEVRALVPEGGSYAIANGGKGRPDQNWVRCDLAPRVPVALRPETCGAWFFERPPKSVPENAVVIEADGSVRIAETRTLLKSLWSGLSGPQVDVPGWIDAPAEDATVAGRVVVTGWCQEKGRGPCAAIRVWLDGDEVDAARIERFPRPDVQAAVPGIGDCSRAGWRTAFDAGALAPGRHCVAAALVVDGGRHRRVGPWTFTVAK
jgi:hypothetical protein